MTKQCVKCKEVKPLTAFDPNKRSKDGLHFRCSICMRTYGQDSPDTRKGKIDKLRMAAWTPEQREKARARDRDRDRVLTPARADSRRKSQKARCERIREYVNTYKLQKGCADCGYREHVAALEFDHLPGKGKVACVGRLAAGHNWNAVLAEIEKCEVVCANCHRIRTDSRRGDS